MKTVFLASLVFSGAVFAQEPPAVLKIVREDMKPGKGAAHEKSEAAFARAFAKTKYPNYIAWESMSGQSQVWFVEAYANFAGIEEAFKIGGTEPLKTTLDQLDVQDSELRSGERTMIARFRKDLSYFAEPPGRPKARFVWVNVARIHLGHAEEFREMRMIEAAAQAKIGAKPMQAVYIVDAGAPLGTYLVVSLFESLKAMDELADWNTRGVLGDQFERYRKLRSDIIISSDVTLFSVNPKMSNPPQAHIDADPDFWAPKQGTK
jgi:hypothetical protein